MQYYQSLQPMFNIEDKRLELRYDSKALEIVSSNPDKKYSD